VQLSNASLPCGGILSIIGNTPLIRLQQVLPDLRFRLYAKLEMLNPGGSGKDRTGISMLAEAWAQGRISRETTVVESSSGNLGIGIAQVCAYLGLRFICVADVRITQANLRLLRAYGAQVDIVEAPDNPGEDLLTARINRVKRLCAEIPDNFWPNQYANPYNARAHHATMREICESLGQEPDFLFTATSTCGTLRGCREFLRQKGARTRVIAVDAEGSVIFGGSRGRRLIPGHGSSRVPELYEPGLADQCLKVSDLDCIAGCYKLLRREALFAGGSSGGVLAAIEKMQDTVPAGSACVAILCDRGDRYLDTIYSPMWVRENFGERGNLCVNSGWLSSEAVYQAAGSGV
jgi:N-(2-amino-2-carboxyethyl)-L-glutamate synthase